jgi:hypothetical protein
VTNGDTPTELTDLLEDIATTDWVALVAALRRVLAGDRGRELLLAGLDHIGAAILTATLDQLSPHRAGLLTSAATIDARTAQPHRYRTNKPRGEDKVS